MAFITRVTRIANPHRSRRSYRRKRTAKANTAPRKRSYRKHKRKTGAKANPGRKRMVYRTKTGRFTRRKPAARRNARSYRRTRRNPASSPRRRIRRATRSNPVLIELGALNPHQGKRRKSVARKYHRRRSQNPRRRASNARRVYHRRRRRNPVAVVHHRRHHRRHHRAHNRRHMNYRHRRHNPALFGRSSAKDILLMVGGGLVGVAATKFLPTLIPAGMLTSLGSSSLVSVAITGAGAFLAGWLASKISKEFGEAVLFGGLMQTGSALLNAFAPPSLSGALALSGVGDIIPGMFVVPQNPIKAYIPPPPPAAKGAAGMGAFRGAFGYRR